jgi:transaldolase/glucose-6-phosphate isomerase
VSLEVSPTLAYETELTISEARRLFTTLNRPNVMIKVPATHQGVPAIETLIGEGINVNVTLLFSIKNYEDVALAYIAGLEKLAAGGGDLSKVASVASFFVSRVDTSVDAALTKIGNTRLQGKIAVANAKLAYEIFNRVFSGQRWQKLADNGAQVQRLLWASTGTKNPNYPDTLYVDDLIGPHTVNTVPPATLQAYIEHGKVASVIEEGLLVAHDQVDQIKSLGIDINAITDKLQEDGVASFAKSFESLMDSIKDKRKELISDWHQMSEVLGSYQETVNKALNSLKEDNIMSRIWAHDHTVWKSQPDEIINRLGWLKIPEVMLDNVDELTAFARDISAKGYTHALLMGMGGSSLAPEVFSKVFPIQDGYLDLKVIDSTDPAAVANMAENLDPGRTLCIVSTKSGTTTETLSFFRYFYNWMVHTVGKDAAGEHFIAITDPESPLVDLAGKYNFHKTFINEPTIGGRYSALSYFGLVPAALIGMDIKLILERAMILAENCESSNCPVSGNNYGARLGVILAEMAKAGRDKATFVISKQIEPFGDWVEQLIAESTGKEGKGIIPIVNEKLGFPGQYRDDRLFVHLRINGDETYDDKLRELEKEGHPLVHICLHDSYDLGGQFFLWEMAIAVAGHILDINPFDQPNVESAKILSREAVNEYKEKGSLPVQTPVLCEMNINLYGKIKAVSLGEALRTFLDNIKDGPYVAIQAYLQPASDTDAALNELRMKIRDTYQVATTLGYGPRFLHSTGQLHKGDAGGGLFIQITSDNPHDVAVPDFAGSEASSISFGVLKTAQALGDWQALQDTGRKILRLHLGTDDIAGTIKHIAEIFE